MKPQILTLPSLKRLFAGLLFTICAMSVSAQTYYLNIYEKNGKWTSFPIANVDSVKLSMEIAPIAGLEYVDLGLSVKWASMNIGAKSPYEAGDFYAWGETQPKASYTNETYKFYQYDETARYYKLTKYGFHSKAGIVDYKYRLDMEDDAARVNWGSEWRMPTAEEMEELVNECQWEWVNDTRLQFVGYKVIGPNGNCIFLPAAGGRWNQSLYHVGSWGVYWSCTLSPSYSIGSTSNVACCLGFYKDDIHWYGNDYRFFGFSVRAVRILQN